MKGAFFLKLFSFAGGGNREAFKNLRHEIFFPHENFFAFGKMWVDTFREISQECFPPSSCHFDGKEKLFLFISIAPSSDMKVPKQGKASFFSWKIKEAKN